MSNFWNQLPKPIIALAPMAGVCDSPFRQICKQHGADVIYTEFLSAEALIRNNKKTLEMLKFSPTEQPLVCQIFGKTPETIAQAARIIEDNGYLGIDLNFGCPAYKVVKTGGGVSLMRNLNKVHDIIAAAMAAVSIPVSIKIRARIGLKTVIRDLIEERDSEDEKLESSGEVTALDLIKKISSLNVPAIMLHSRSYEQAFDGTPDLDMVKAVRQIYPGTLIVNGGIYSPEEAKRQLEKTGADGVGLARGVQGNPWLFQQIHSVILSPALAEREDPMDTAPSYSQPTWNERKTTMLDHAKLSLQIKGEQSIIELRKHLAWYCKGLPNAKELRAQLVQVKTLDDIEKVLA
ncbi:MAG: tRNA-dihydrouridine synthase [Candidatus Komeilibacteria bacterium]|nr:tRNA-dihydrouridine synthase [Candidatus Komeilibacteria bacterium]